MTDREREGERVDVFAVEEPLPRYHERPRDHAAERRATVALLCVVGLVGGLMALAIRRHRHGGDPNE